MIQEVKAYITSDGAVLTCKATAAYRELCILLGLGYDQVKVLIENDDKVITLLQEYRKAQPAVRKPRR